MAPNFRPARSLIVLLALIAGAAVIAAQGAPRITQRDQLTISVFGVEGLSGKFSVGADGSINYPHLGSVIVAGLSTRDVEAELAKQLKESGYLLNPQVTVELIQTANKRITVTGAVRAPGQVPFAGDLTLLEALALVGSTTVDAGDRIVVRRAAGPSASPTGASADEDATTARRPEQGGVIEVSLSDLENGRIADSDLRLHDGDHINVPRVQQVFISGQVRSPGGYTVPNGSSVLQALTLAGGLTDRGTMRGIRIIRDKKEIKDVKPDALVRPGDTIIVKASPF